MRLPVKVSIMVCLILMIFVRFTYAGSEGNARCCDEEYPKVIVQGEGRIEVIADKAHFKMSVRVEEKKLERTFEESTKKINSISDILSSFNVKKEDIKNLGYIYHPLYEGKRIFTSITRPTSYEVVYTLKITLYDMEELGKVLAALSEIPETTIYGLEYTSTKLEELKRETLKKAASDAREKAVKLSEGAGATLGKVIKIETGVQVSPLRQYDSYVGGAIRAEFKGENVTPQIESGYLEVIGNCTVYYSIQ